MSRVKIVEVGPRDGLQNEKVSLDIKTRLEFAERLAMAGVRHIELGAFVSPQWVPQMAGASELMLTAQQRSRIPGHALMGSQISALVPNPRGMQDALAADVRHIAIFGSVSEAFAKKNINCSIDESFIRFSQVMQMAEAAPSKIKVRGYLSMCFGCPFEGKISEGRVVRLAKRMLHLGVDEISIGDTIGVANPKQVRSLVGKLIDAIGVEALALHFHDTRGTALANILASLDLGVRVFDSSLGGLGGCPYAPAATGNVATEDVVYMLHGMGFATGIDLQKLIEINRWITGHVQRELPSRLAKAGLPGW